MNEDTKLILEKFRKIGRECERFCFMTRGIEFQKDACKSLGSLKNEVSRLKRVAIDQLDEDSANALLSIEEMIDALWNELMMWINLKEDDSEFAWRHLVQAVQGSLENAITCSASPTWGRYAPESSGG
jgi:hypothetical protein